jgi:hypothetical protein
MFNLECPKCGRLGTVPNEKANSRLVCKKCHTIFHLSPTGRVLLGDPPLERKEEHKSAGRSHWEEYEDQPKLSFSLPELNISPLQLGIGSLVIAVVGFMYFLSTLNLAEDLGKKADRALAAMMTGDVDTLKQFATPETAEATEAWYDTMRSYLEDVRGLPSGLKPIVTVMVSEENVREGNGQTLVYITAPKPGQHKATAKQAPEQSDYLPANQLTFNWSLDRYWKWRLRGEILPPVPVISTTR